MWQQLDKIAALFLVVALPLAWGLAVEYAFELARRRHNRADPGRESGG